MTDIGTEDVCASDPPLDHDAAAKLDERIRRMAKATKGNLDALNELIEKAKAGQIHPALSYISWTAYLTDALSELCADVDSDTRKHIAVMLHHEGMSIRDSALTTGLSKSTVQREVSQSGTVYESAPATMGHDGKVRSRRQDAAQVATSQRKPITTAFLSASCDLMRVINRVARLRDDDRFNSNRDAIAGIHLHDLIRARDTLSDVIQQLEGPKLSAVPTSEIQPTKDR